MASIRREGNKKKKGLEKGEASSITRIAAEERRSSHEEATALINGAKNNSAR